MKLYHFNPNGYGFEFFVIAESKLKAHEYLVNSLRLKSDSGNNYTFTHELNSWIDVDPLDTKTFPINYTLDEHDVGDVVITEIS